MQSIRQLKKLAIFLEVLSKNEPVLIGGPEISGLVPENWPMHHEPRPGLQVRVYLWRPKYDIMYEIGAGQKFCSGSQ